MPLMTDLPTGIEVLEIGALWLGLAFGPVAAWCLLVTFWGRHR